MTTEPAPQLTMEGAAFDAFRKRGRSGVLTSATIAYVVCAALLYGAAALIAWQAIGEYFTWAITMSSQAGDYATTPAEAFLPPASLFSLIPLMIVFGIALYILFAAYEAACLRWLVRGEAGGGLFGLTFGADTWRVALGYLLWLALLWAAELAAALVIALPMGVMFAAGGGANAGFAILFAVVAAFAICAVCIYFAVRLAPAAATSIASRRFNFFGAWHVTRGRFWSLFGAFALLYVLYFVAVIVIYMVGFFALFGSVFSTLAASSGAPDEAAVEAAMAGVFSSPGAWASFAAFYAVALFVALMFIIGLFGVNARAASVALAEGRIIPTPPPTPPPTA